MIYGTGVDIIKIDRVERLSHKEAFMNKFFTKFERSYLKGKSAESIAGIFSAKEAVVKSMGTGFTGFKFTDVEILREKNEPYVTLHGNAKKIAEDSGICNIKVSISHEKEFAIANAIALMKSKKIEGYPINVLRKREKNSHKGTYGKVCIIGGSYNMSGAIILAANAALRAGSGLVSLAIPESIVDRVASSIYETTYIPLKDDCGTMNIDIKDINLILKEKDSIAIGPGIGDFSNLCKPMEYLITNSKKPIVIDADGINLLAENKYLLDLNRNCNIIITPHTVEMKRLSGLEVSYIEKNRVKVAKEISLKYNLTVVLKGHETVVAKGEKIYINTTGNPGMATAGSGDVLTGIIVSLLGQGYSDYDSAVLGCYLHGLSGDASYEKYGYGLKASDIADNIGQFIK